MLFRERLDQAGKLPRWVLIGVVAVVIALAGALGIVRATATQFDSVKRVPSVAAVLSMPTVGLENYLLVGSDTRTTADPTDADYKNIGSADTTGGQRSDTMMILRYDATTHDVALLSVPRDLWVKIGDSDRSNRLNTAYQVGPEVLIRTVQRALNIPIHHYLEVDFQGFKGIIDGIGGIDICVKRPARDRHTGLIIRRRGCSRLGGTQALAFVRSRFYESKKDGVWQMDGTSDIGRSTRQRDFVSALLKGSVKYVSRNPMAAHDVMASFADSLTVDPSLKLVDMARKLRPAADAGTGSYSLTVVNDVVRDAEVLRLSTKSNDVLAYFAGTGPAPAPAPK